MDYKKVYPFSQHLPGTSFEYSPAVAGQTFTERFNEATADMPETELAVTLGLSVSAVRKLRAGDQHMLKLDAGLRLCDKLGMDPWMLAFGRSRQAGAPIPEADAAQLDAAHTELRSLRDEVRELIDAQLKKDKEIARMLDVQIERDQRISAIESTIERLATLVEHLQPPQ